MFRLIPKYLDSATQIFEFFVNPLNHMGRYTGSREGVQNTLRAGIPAFAMVCQNPEGALDRHT